jgi:hypothetical protein
MNKQAVTSTAHNLPHTESKAETSVGNTVNACDE